MLNITMIYSPCAKDPGGTLTISRLTILPVLFAVNYHALKVRGFLLGAGSTFSE